MAEPKGKSGDGAADVLTIFGISGDLAKKMTFRALYRLEAGEKLDCPIVGVAIDDWDEKRLREHAREAIGATIDDPDEDIFSLGFVNSLLAMQLVAFVEKEFGVAVGDEDLDLDNFRTINSIAALVARKRGAAA